MNTKKSNSILVRPIPKGAVTDEAKASLATDSAHDGALVSRVVGNLPIWAKMDEMKYWEAVDQFERKSGPACHELTLSLPKDLTVEQAQALVSEFAREEFGTKAFLCAIRAAQTESAPSHAKLLVSGRVQDGLERNQEQFFRRYRTILPAFSGCRKDGQGRVRPDVTDSTLSRLQNWRRICASVDE